MPTSGSAAPISCSPTSSRRWGCAARRRSAARPVSLELYTEDADALFAQAVAAGARVLRPVADQFYGDRGGKLEDPFGHVWWIATHKADISPEEMQRRASALFGGA